MKKRIELVQEILKKKGLYKGRIDGLNGPKTLKGLEQVEGIDQNWPDKRKIIGAVQVFAEENKINAKPIDGLWGPVTEEAFNELSDLVRNNAKPRIWRPEEILDVNLNNWPRQYTAEFIDFYGEMGKNQDSVVLPYPHRLSWQTDKVINRFDCHIKVKESIARVLTKAFNHYGLSEIKRLNLDLWGGCFNVRPIRGGTRPSMHSWGIAIDYDPIRNKLKWGRDKAAFAKPEYDKWWELWEEEGWVSLGRQRNFDWMHVQACKI